MEISRRHKWENNELNLAVLTKAAQSREHFNWILKVEFIRRSWKWSMGGGRRAFKAEEMAFSKFYIWQTT